MNDNKFLPKNHQNIAIDDILNSENGLIANNKTQFISACGTGKTLTAMWTVEKYLFDIRKQAESLTIYFYPSLALVSQSFQSYKSQTSIKDYNPLFICSDSNIYKDFKSSRELDEDITFEELQSEIGNYIVTTKNDDIESYLKSDVKNKIIFSTYHSSHLLAQSLRNLHITADIAVFDEAHNIALNSSSKESVKSIILHDQDTPTKNNEYLPVKKRLFMTATPRHYQIKQDENVSTIDDTELAYSMDNEDVFGNVSHLLTTKEAINKRLIADYRVIAIYVDREYMNDYISTNKMVKDSDKELWKQAQEAIKIIAILKAMTKYDINKTVLFNGTIENSKKITKDIEKNHKNFNIRHIDGSMNHSEKARIMKELQSYENIIVSNSKLLSEGVDVPSIDMVAFLNTTKSLRDIVQRLGRTQRFEKDTNGNIKDENRVGYIFVPIMASLLEPETQSQFNLNKDARDFYNIVNSLREMDGEASITEDFKFSDKVVLDNLRDIDEELKEDTEENKPKSHYKLLKDQYINFVSASLIGENHDREEKWMKKYSILKEYYFEFNKYPTTVSGYTIYKGIDIGNFISNIRQNYIKQSLTNKKIALLKNIKFVFEPNISRIEELAKKLEVYLKQYEKLPYSDSSTGTKLNNYLNGLSIYDGEYRQDPIYKLIKKYNLRDSIKIHKIRWMEMYYLYKETIENNYDITQNELYKGKRLVWWIKKQKKKYNLNELNKEEIVLLESVGFRCKKENEDWLNKLSLEISKFYLKFNDYSISSGYINEENYPLGRKFFELKTIYKKHKEDRVKESFSAYNIPLNILQKNLKQENWNKAFGILVDFMENKDEKITKNTKHHDFLLGNWVFSQKRKYANGKLTKNEIEKLKKYVDFKLKAKKTNSTETKTTWETFLSLYLESLSLGLSKDGESLYKGVNLEKWVREQKSLFSRDRLSTKRIDILNQNNFNFTIVSKEEQRYLMFKENYQKNKNTLDQSVESGIYTRLCYLRKRYEKGEVSKEYIEKYESLGIVWDKNQHDFIIKIKKLVEYIKNNGSVKFTKETPEDIYNNYKHLRYNYKRGVISKKQKEYLVSYLDILGLSGD